ncbi:hypothetical protein BH20BAC1_BH20BAC1_07220 [soil metagenome]
MTQVTQEDLVRYLYNETSEQKSELIREALANDINLKNTFEEMQMSKKSLEHTELSPRPQSIDKILAYAASQEKQLHSH